MQSSEKNHTLRDFFYVIFKFKMTIMIFTFSSVVVAILYSYTFPPKYEATSRILIKMVAESVPQGSGMFKPSSVITNINPSEIINSEIELLKGRYIAEEIMNTMGHEILYPPVEVPKTIWQKIKSFLRKNSVMIYEWTEDQLSALGLMKKLSPHEKATLSITRGLSTQVIRNSNSVKVNFKSTNPDLAAKVVNLAVSLYLKHRIKLHSGSNVLDFFSYQTANFRRNLEEAERNLKEFKDRWNVSSIEEQKRHILNLNSEIRSEIDKTDIELSKLDRKVSTIKNLLPLGSSDGTDGNISNPSHVVDSLRLKLMDLKLKKMNLLARYTENSPLITLVSKEIKEIEGELRKEEVKSAVSVDIDALKSKRKTLSEILEKSNEELIKFNQLDYELRDLMLKVRENEHLYNTYFEKTEESRISQAMDTAKITNVRVIEPAYAPIISVRTIKFIPQRIFNIILSFIVGIFVSITIIALVEIFDHSFKSSEDTEEYLGLRVLGTISDYQYVSRKAGLSFKPKL